MNRKKDKKILSKLLTSPPLILLKIEANVPQSVWQKTINKFGLTLKKPGYLDPSHSRGGADSAPPSDLGRRTRDRDENLHARRPRRTLSKCMVTFFENIFFYFILINYSNLCIKSEFGSKSLITAPIKLISL